ncbi:MAG: Modification methylase VspI [Verrucomicrobia subdivision 3 bacterium]|nr:Modification methylase VspI [Limisphaerales bacterium]MCS1417367.1 Modification methylase VspI [Limisphaerales bacterium]
MQQQSLFLLDPDKELTITDVALALNVSEASVRNWVKAGYLVATERRFISRHSLDNFVQNIAGQEKLTHRANKSHLDSHDHVVLSCAILEKLTEDEIGAIELADYYETGLSNSYRNKEGIYYTSPGICRELLGALSTELVEKTFCDPCCGTGNFLIAAIEAGIRPDNVYGFDTDPVAVEIARKRFAELVGYKSDNITCDDYLEFATRTPKGEVNYDVIITNPPWGKKLPKEKKREYGMLLRAGRSLDTSSLFLFASLSCLTPGGYIGFLLPEAFFNISQFQDAREKLLENRLIALYDFGRPFPGLLTKARAFLMSADEPNACTDVTCFVSGRKYRRKSEVFKHNPASIINMTCMPEDEDVIERFFGTPHLTLHGQARWGLGIVTGNNKKFCKSEQVDGFMPVYKGSEVFPDRLAEPSSYIPRDTRLYQQVAPVELYEAPEKLIYRFISSNLIFYYDTNQSYILNSANLIVLNANFPVSARKVAALFNMRIYNWIFQKLFETHKVLRSDIERLPVFDEFLKSRENPSEIELLEYLSIEETRDGTFRVKG